MCWAVLVLSKLRDRPYVLQTGQFWPIRTGTQARGDENKSAKYGLTACKDQITLHLRLCSWKHLSGNQAARDLMNRGLPWLPGHERFGPNMTRTDLKVAQGAPHSCCDACLRGDSAWIGPVLHNCGVSEPEFDADPRQKARETMRSEEK